MNSAGFYGPSDSALIFLSLLTKTYSCVAWTSRRDDILLSALISMEVALTLGQAPVPYDTAVSKQ